MQWFTQKFHIFCASPTGNCDSVVQVALCCMFFLLKYKSVKVKLNSDLAELISHHIVHGTHD